MANLSPVAQAVWESFNEVTERVGVFEDYGDALASAFRTAANKIADDIPPGQSVWGEGFFEGAIAVRDGLLAIAHELEASNG